MGSSRLDAQVSARDAVFAPEVRAGIVLASGGGCAGCGRATGLNVQHRRARGSGGSSDERKRRPCNGVALCGSGTTGCHGWCEQHPHLARDLGWRIDAGVDPRTPFYTCTGWRAWICEGDPDRPRDWLVELIEPLSMPARNRAAAVKFRAWLAGRTAGLILTRAAKQLNEREEP